MTITDFNPGQDRIIWESYEAFGSAQPQIIQDQANNRTIVTIRGQEALYVLGTTSFTTANMIIRTGE